MPKILLIEDDECFRVVMRRVLEQRGFEVIEAASATTGVRLASASLPDLILSDVQMEDGDGYAALVALRQSNETEAIPFILITGRPSLAGMRRGMDQGADDYLEKPFTFDAMFSAVHARLKKREAIERHVHDHQGCEPPFSASVNQDNSRPLSRRN
jgi:DNA-binding response OmpR family regulator